MQPTSAPGPEVRQMKTMFAVAVNGSFGRSDVHELWSGSVFCPCVSFQKLQHCWLFYREVVPKGTSQAANGEVLCKGTWFEPATYTLLKQTTGPYSTKWSEIWNFVHIHSSWLAMLLHPSQVSTLLDMASRLKALRHVGRRFGVFQCFHHLGGHRWLARGCWEVLWCTQVHLNKQVCSP